MNMHEWALIIFTILTQMTVGSFLVLGTVHFYAVRKKGMAAADRLSDRALLVLVPVLALAMLVSLLHLGNPLKAPFALSNLSTSWLSREILSTVVFGTLAVLFVFLQYRKIGQFQMRNAIAWIAGLAGLALICCMSRVYMIPTKPAWNTTATPISFFITTLLLGSWAMGAAFIANYSIEQRKKSSYTDEQCKLMLGSLRGIALVSIILLGLEFIVLPVYLGYLATAGVEAQMSASLIVEKFRGIFILRLLLVFIGAGIFGTFLYKNANSKGSESLTGYLGYGAFALVLIAEVLGRFLFYFSEIRIGV